MAATPLTPGKQDLGESGRGRISIDVPGYSGGVSIDAIWK
jgi:hypothetical protein